MSDINFKKDDIVSHVSSKELLKIIDIGPRYIRVLKLSGAETEFRPEFLTHASEEERTQVKDKFTSSSHKIEVSGVKTGDIQKTLSGFNTFAEEIRQKHPGSHEHLMGFWSDLIAIAGNYPATSWGMRKDESEHYCPVLRVYNGKTDRWNQFFYVLWWDKVRLEIAKSHVPPEHEELFPEKNTMYGTCNAVEMALPEFLSKKQQYLNCIKEVYRKNPDPKD